MGKGGAGLHGRTIYLSGICIVLCPGPAANGVADRAGRLVGLRGLRWGSGGAPVGLREIVDFGWRAEGPGRKVRMSVVQIQRPVLWHLNEKSE